MRHVGIKKQADRAYNRTPLPMIRWQQQILFLAAISLRDRS
jgi:hypothetical protein